MQTKMNILTIVSYVLIFLGGMGAILLAYSQAIGSEKDKKEIIANTKEQNTRLKEDLNLIKNERDSLSKILAERDERIKVQNENILELSNKLFEKSDTQLREIDRIRNPIPEKVSVFFEANFDLTKKEVDDINNIIREHDPSRGNLLPFDYNKPNSAFDKMNALRDLGIQINITLEKEGKTLSFVLKQMPMLFAGYHHGTTFNTFLVAAQDDNITLSCLDISTSEISSSDKSPSILNFKNSKVKVTYEFFYPKNMRIGNGLSKMYMAENRDYITFNFRNITLRDKNYSINIRNLVRKDSHTYEGVWEGK